jgi:hypothetical protein
MAQQLMSTFGLGRDPFTDAIFVLGPANTLSGGASGAGAPPSLGSSTPATGQTLTAGNWLAVSGDTATIITSDGTETAPSSGNVYEII